MKKVAASNDSRTSFSTGGECRARARPLHCVGWQVWPGDGSGHGTIYLCSDEAGRRASSLVKHPPRC